MLQSYDDEHLESIRPRLHTYKCAFPEDEDVPLAHYYLGNAEDYTVVKLDMEPQPAGGPVLGGYMASSKWMDDSSAFYTTLVRRGNKSASFILVNTDGEVKELYREDAQTSLNIRTHGQLDGFGHYWASNYLSADRQILLWQSERDDYARLFRYDGNSWERVIAPQKRAIRSLQASGDSLLYFVSDLNGVSNIYGYRPENDELRQIASSPFSAANPYMDEEGSLWYSDYDKHGYQPVKLASKDFENREASFSRPFLNPITEHNARQAEKYVVPLSAREDSLLRKSVDSLESRPYSKVLHGIHIHSWFPLYVNPNRIMNDIGRFNLDNWYEFASLGATLISQNELGTVSAMAAYSYRSDKWRQYHGAHLNVNYSGLYPVFEISADFNDRPRNISTVTLIDERIGKLRYEHGNNALTASALVYVPINLSRGGWYTGLTPQFRYIFSNDKLTYIYKNQSFSSNGIHSLRAGFSWYSQLAQAKARLKPRLGFGVSAIVQTDVEMIPFSHRLEAVNAYAYLPGVAKEDNFKLTYNFQHQGGLVTNERLVKLPRGYSTDPLLRNYHGFSLDYAFPVNFNGLDGGWFFYLKRLELIPFADYGYDFGNKDNKFGSAGISMLVRTYLFRIGTELHFGVQYAHTLEGTDSFKFILSSGF